MSLLTKLVFYVNQASRTWISVLKLITRLQRHLAKWDATEQLQSVVPWDSCSGSSK